MPVTGYPRTNGVLVPASLKQAGCPVRDDATEPGERARAANEIVAWLRQTHRRLPSELLDAEWPEPAVILKTWTIGGPTRGALERIMSRPGASAVRKVRTYLGAERLGFRGLVDLLAASEEAHARRPAEDAEKAAPQQPSRAVSSERLDALTASIRALLPLQPSELVGALAADRPPGLASFEDVVRLYRARDVRAPFRVVRRAGATVLVAPEALMAAETLLANAAHAVFQWGVCTTQALVDRVHALTALPLSTGVVARILRAIPRFRWVDEASGAFSFTGYDTRLGRAVRKVCAVTRRPRLADLRVALSKSFELLRTLPERAFAAYLSGVLGCVVDGGWVGLPAAFVPAPIDRSERTLIDVLAHAGGEATLRALGRRASDAGLSARAVRTLIRTSPLVLEHAGSLRLVGAPSAHPAPGRKRPARIAHAPLRAGHAPAA
jgi:hypothetical protein